MFKNSPYNKVINEGKLMVMEVKVDINENIGINREFIVIPKFILGIKELNPIDKLIYARIAGFDEYFESQAHCADFLGVSERAVGEAKRKLEKMGLITCIENTGRGKVYKVLLDQDFQKTESRLPKFGTLTSKKRNSDFQNLEPYNKEYNKEYISPKSDDSGVSKVKVKKEPSKEATELAEYLKKKILESQPTAHIDRNYKTNWAKDIDKAIRLDGRKPLNLKGMIDYCYQYSDFWNQNIRSGAKLRKHYDRIEMEIRNMYMRHGTVVVGDINEEPDITKAPF